MKAREDRDELWRELNSESVKLMRKIERLIEREQPRDDVATWALMNLAIAKAIDDVGWSKETVMTMFSDIFKRYLAARQRQDSH